MKRNKKFYGLMAGILAVALVTPMASHVAKADSLYSDVVAWYDFNDSALTNSKGSSQASSIVKGLGSYAGELQFESDRTDAENGKSLKLDGGYGIELNQKNLGDEFSVSLWVKPNGAVPTNTPVVFLGYHDPEKWYGISGDNQRNSRTKIWCRNPQDGYNGWFTKSNATITANTWHHIVITGSGNTHTTYVDGVCLTNGVDATTFTNVLKGENQDIYIGANNWDPSFKGDVDDVIVYKRAITAGEVQRLFTGETAAQLLNKSEIAAANLSTFVSRTASLVVSIPEAVKDDAKISYKIEDTSIATIDKDGVVTGKSAGSTNVVVTVKVDDVEKTATAVITVESSLEKFLEADYGFDGEITDATGKTKAEVLGKLLSKYTGQVSYADGIKGKALDFNNYGVKLNLANLGTEYTVNFYVKPESKQAENQVMMLLGYHDPELWTAISGTGAENEYKLWANTKAAAKTTGNVTPMSWTTLANPVMRTGEWTMVTLVGTDGQLSLYLDGEFLGTKGYNNPLCGENQDIYFGVNNWDTCFDGLIDEVKVYSVGLNAEEIQTLNQSFISGRLQASLNEVAAEDVILGENLSASEIRYDLSLPLVANGEEISWTSSNEKVISTSGKLGYPKEATKVTLTATVKNAAGEASKTFELTVLPLDKSKLESLLERAKEIDTKNADETSKTRLENAIALAKAADNYAKVEKAERMLSKAIDLVVFDDIYADPFSAIEEAKTELAMKTKEKKEVFTIPSEVLNSVSVKYVSEDEKVAKYDDGIVKAVGAGKTIVTAIVTAKSDNYVMEYSTAVSVTAKASGGNGSGSTAGTISAGNVSKPATTTAGQASANTATTTTTTATNNAVVIEDEEVPTTVEENAFEESVAEESVAEESVVEEASDETVKEIADDEVPEAGAEAEKATGKSLRVATVTAIILVIIAIIAAAFVYLRKSKKTN